jgi:hypothetical protein
MYGGLISPILLIDAAGHPWPWRGEGRRTLIGGIMLPAGVDIIRCAE